MEPLFPLDPDGADGYVTCELGHAHWGKAGAAGLLLHTMGENGETLVLLQHRSPEVHLGDCWGVPGGALDWDESVEAAAIRETAEELVSFPAATVQSHHVHVVDHGGWSYSTVVASVEHFEPEGSGWETGEHGWRWVPLHEVADLDLHPGFASSLPALTEALSYAAA